MKKKRMLRFLNTLRMADDAAYCVNTNRACICTYSQQRESKKQHTDKEQTLQQTPMLTHTVAANAPKYLLTCFYLISPCHIPEILFGGWVTNLRKTSRAKVVDICVLTCHHSGTPPEHFKTAVKTAIECKYSI